MMDQSACPCGSGRPFAHCCGPYLSGDAVPATAEALMRSRFTAYTRQDETYLLQSWHHSTRPLQRGFTQQAPVKWLGLKIIRTSAGGKNDDTGTVEFVARYKINGKAERLHENSRFVKEAGHWFYLRGEIDSGT